MFRSGYPVTAEHPRYDPTDPTTCGHQHATAADFRLSSTDSRFHWAGEPRPGLPLLHWPRGAVCEPVYIWFAHSVAAGRVVPSSLLVEAYALRAWLAWLWRRGISWDRPNDQLLREWRAERLAGAKQIGGSAPSSRRPSQRQVERAIAIVFAFYSGLPEAMVMGADRRPYPIFVGPADASPRCPVTSRVVQAETRFGWMERSSWRWTGRVPRRRVRRVTPTGSDVGRLLERLRGRAAVEPSRRRTRSAAMQRTLACERDWLMARCMAEAGLRAEEVAGLSVAALARGLEMEGALGLVAASSPVSHDRDGRARILTKLDAITVAGRSVIEVEVTCKGATRAAPFPIPLVRDLLSIGLWVVREAVLRRAAGCDPHDHRAGSVFLSLKTGFGLSPGSVADVMHDGFRGIGVSSSGHRLRASFAENLAFGLLRERMALNGGVLDESVEAWVLRRVADALGHASIGTTVTHYIDRAILQMGRSQP